MTNWKTEPGTKSAHEEAALVARAEIIHVLVGLPIEDGMAIIAGLLCQMAGAVRMPAERLAAKVREAYETMPPGVAALVARARPE